jgi:hypothetical protein
MFSFLEFLVEVKNLTLQYHKRLNPRLWENGRLKPGIKTQLLRHADNFVRFNGLNLSSARDIIITGSNSNYNYTRHSDIDVHLLYDVSNMSSDDLYKKKAEWTAKNKNLVLQGFGYPYIIEFYIENVRDRTMRPSGQGVYSLKTDKWLIEPKHLDTVAILKDPRVLVKINHEIEYVKTFLLKKGTKNDILNYKEKLYRMRSSGLQKAGEFSIENVMYKDLRNRGLIDKLNTKLKIM